MFLNACSRPTLSPFSDSQFNSFSVRRAKLVTLLFGLTINFSDNFLPDLPAVRLGLHEAVLFSHVLRPMLSARLSASLFLK